MPGESGLISESSVTAGLFGLQVTGESFALPEKQLTLEGEKPDAKGPRAHSIKNGENKIKDGSMQLSS